MTKHIHTAIEAVLFIAGMTVLLIAFTGCASTQSVQKPIGPADLRDSIRVVNPAAIRAQQACKGKYKPEWCGDN